ncbi:MAG: branched-chain amino acid ABC transporter permease [Pseudonocardiaceae bacterium]|nr:MAG: branched-chain amino acid ABC transporter permease [Pseudonocardiaceae bacterium]
MSTPSTTPATPDTRPDGPPDDDPQPPSFTAERHVAPRWVRWGVPVALAIVAILLPLVGIDSAQQFLLAYMAIIALLAVSLHFLMGIAGLFSLGQAAFFGVGAYVGVVLMDKLGWDGAIALPLVAVAGALVGLLMAVATLRASDLYLALTTLAFGFVGENVVRNIDYLGGAQGLAGFDLHFFGLTLDDPLLIYWIGLGCLILFGVMITSMRRSKLGRALMAGREGPIAARSIGVDTGRYRFLAFGLSGAFAAIAGSLYTAYAYVLDPSVFSLGLTTTVLTIAIVGGLRSLPGVLVAAVVLTWFRSAVDGEAISEYVLLIYAALVVVTLLFLPQGIGGAMSTLFRRLANRKGRS